MKIKNISHKQQFEKIFQEIQNSKQKAYHQANKTLVNLYLNIGKFISINVHNAKWGRGIVLELAVFIKQKEPNIQGFTARNLWRMKQFYETYKDNPKLSPLVSELTWTKLIPKELLRDKLNQVYELLDNNEEQLKKELD